MNRTLQDHINVLDNFFNDVEKDIELNYTKDYGRVCPAPSPSDRQKLINLLESVISCDDVDGKKAKLTKFRKFLYEFTPFQQVPHEFSDMYHYKKWITGHTISYDYENQKWCYELANSTERITKL